MKSKLSEVSSQMRTYMRKALDLPSNVTVNVIAFKIVVKFVSAIAMIILMLAKF